MLRNYIHETSFRESLKEYLNRYRYNTAETDDLRHVCEDVSGISLQRFFYQWIYRAGHPVLDIELSLDNSQLGIIIRQVSGGKNEDDEHKEDPESKITTFDIQIDVKLWFSPSANTEPETHTFDTSNEENIFKIDIDATKVNELKYVSMDPELKVLKKIRSIKVTNWPKHFQIKELLKEQLKHGESVVERIDAARLLGVVLPNIGDIIAYRHGLHSCQEVYPYRNQQKV